MQRRNTRENIEKGQETNSLKVDQAPLVKAKAKTLNRNLKRREDQQEEEHCQNLLKLFKQFQRKRKEKNQVHRFKFMTRKGNLQREILLTSKDPQANKENHLMTRMILQICWQK